MFKVIDFDDAVKTIRKNVKKGVSEASNFAGKEFTDFYKSSFKSADEIAFKVAQKERTIEAAKRSATKFKATKEAEVAAARKAFKEAKSGTQLGFDLDDMPTSKPTRVATPNTTKNAEQLSFDIDTEIRSANGFKSMEGTQTSMFEAGQQSLFDMGPSMDTTAYAEALKVDANNIKQKRLENKFYNRPELEKQLAEKQYQEKVNRIYNRPELEKKLKTKGGSSQNKAATGDGNNWVYKAASAGVGGGLVLSMANNKGQQSNSQLYGQRGY